MGRQTIKQPLLQPLYPNCPGCKVAHLSADGAPPSYKELTFVAVVMLCNGENLKNPSLSLFRFDRVFWSDFICFWGFEPGVQMRLSSKLA
jgi:hypothetical protein